LDKTMALAKTVGVVAIGRNEGQRLYQCLSSAVSTVAQIVYVDSGSTDDSVELAQSLGIEVVNLDLSIPFTAARARNAGFARLMAIAPQIEWVQFVDGDCQLVEGWINRGQIELESNPNVAVVCGRRRERHPEGSIYNQLCDLEWNTPIGDTKACGGDALMRVSAFQQLGGFNPSLIAGEEPELCVRLRQQGWLIRRIDAEMTLHDAQMMHFGQWWNRSVRAGHAYVEGAWLHGREAEHHWVRESLSIGLWGILLPCLALGLAWPTQGRSVFLLLAYPAMASRIFMKLRQKLDTHSAIFYALSCVIGKFAQSTGALKFLYHRLSGNHSTLIEYKG
jgi:glycosyltransferase involved in cell wall biosynthesis